MSGPTGKDAPANELTAKISRLLDGGGELRAQAAEMIRSLDDPEVDDWVLSGARIHQMPVYPDFWEIPRPLKGFSHPKVSPALVLDLLRRRPGGPAATALLDGLDRLYVDGAGSDGVLRLSWLDGLSGITELLVTASSIVDWRWKRDDPGGGRLAGLDVLARLPRLRWLVVAGASEVDLAALAAVPGLERLSVYGSTIAADAYDLRDSRLARLDLEHVAGLPRLVPPRSPRELHLTSLPDLTTIGDLSTASALTELSIVDCQRVTALPALPPPDAARRVPAERTGSHPPESTGSHPPESTGSHPPESRGLRRVRLACPALTSIAPLAGRTLESLDLTGCAALTSLDGFPETLEATQLSLHGCARVSDLSAVIAAGGALRSLDLRDVTGLTDVSALDRLPGLAALALAGTPIGPEAVPAAMLPSCTWAHTPDLDLLGQRPGPRPGGTEKGAESR